MDKRTLNARPERFRSIALALLALLLFCGDAGANSTIPLDVTVGKSVILTTQNLKTISITDKTIADYIVISQKEVQIIGKKPGTTSMITWDAAGMKTFFDVNVNVDTMMLEERIADAAPGDPVIVKAMKNTIIVSGSVKNTERYFRVDELLKAVGVNVTDNKTVTYLTGGQSVVTSNTGTDIDTGIKYANLLEISDQPQVLLQITVASIDRKATRELGINWAYASSKAIGLFSGVGGVTAGAAAIDDALKLSSTGATAATSSATGGPQFGVLDSRNNTTYFLKALAGKGLAKILAEPNLIVKSGATGRFKAGGEFPYPEVSSVTGGTTLTVPSVSIVFKDFGVIMDFQPVVKESGIIELKLANAEVSTLDFANGIFIGGTQVPLVKIDNLSSSVNLKDGESFVVAGLMQDEWSKNLNKIPVLGDIPILGAFFRDQSMSKTERELVFFVTPTIVKPLAAGTKPDLPGANEPSAAQSNDQRWIPLMPTDRSIDIEKTGK